MLELSNYRQTFPSYNNLYDKLISKVLICDYILKIINWNQY